MTLAPGDVFAGYRIVRLLGSGGMGEVYLAQHPRLPRQDALKILHIDVSADQDYRQRFIREADLAAKLWHPNIVRVNDRGEFNGQLWIAMDYVDGTDAASLLRDRYPVGMPADEVATIIAAIASALNYAHAHDLLHRDVKPANILLANPEDGERRILLSDFGIARTIGDISGLTATNMTIGTVAYAAPEQLMGEDIDGRADQYALAATAYHLLTGSTLFPQSNPAVVISRHLTAPPPKLADTRPGLAAFDPVLAVALAKNPADRFARCTDFALAFAKAARSGGHATASASTRAAPLAGRPPESAVPSARADADKQKRRRRGILLGAAVAVVASVVGIALWVSKPDKPQSNPTTTAAAPSAPVAAPPAPPVTTTVTTPPVTVTAQTTEPPTQVTTTMPPLVFTAAQDQRLLNDLSSMGYAIPNPALVVHEAHQYCLLVRQGEDSSQVNQDIQAATGWDASYTLQVTSGAILAYPNCRGYPLAP